MQIHALARVARASASVTKKTAAAQMSATAPYYSIPFSGRADFLYSHDSLLTLSMRGGGASYAALRRNGGVLPRHPALAKAYPFGMVNECHEAGRLSLTSWWAVIDEDANWLLFVVCYYSPVSQAASKATRTRVGAFIW